MSKATVPKEWLDRAEKEDKTTFNPQAYAYLRLTKNEISLQSTDQLLRSRFIPVEFDGFRLKVEAQNIEPEKEEK